MSLGSLQQTNMQQAPGEGFCCVFDGISSVGLEDLGYTENVLLAGFERGLDVFHIDKKRFHLLGRLSDLRGTVIGAKLLPLQSNHPRASRPLVAIIVHGPYVPEDTNPKPGTDYLEKDEFEPSGSMIHALHTADTTHYQTTVEVYSLRKGGHVATLFRSPRVEMETRPHDSRPLVPPAVGGLSIQAKGKFVTVSSGTSGEVFIFKNMDTDKEGFSSSFKCIGKTWTRILPKGHRSASISSSEFEGPGHHEGSSSVTHGSSNAISSLSSRWLAVVPPASSAQTTLHGRLVPDESSHRFPGVSSHTSPAEPQITCHLDAPEGESFLNKIARDGTQTLMKGARWVGDQGMQAWANYWSKPSDQAHQSVAGSPPYMGPTAPNAGQQYFPPTHAQDTATDREKNQPTLVSILDLEKLSQNQHSKTGAALQPVATFSLPSGCSMLSFSPTGLHLLTASARGDVQQTWDLMRMIHGDTGRLGGQSLSTKGPNVREIARFTRMTEARIIDVVWTEPNGARLAVVTERGTVHIYDMPSSAFQWPPPRRVVRNANVSNKPTRPDSHDDEVGRPESLGGTISSAFGMFAGTAQPLLAAVRGRRPSSGSGFPGFGGLASTAGAGAKGGKAVAAGVNRSVSAAAVGTYNTIRHLGENRVTVPGSPAATSPGCVRWLQGKEQGLLAVAGGGQLRIHVIQQSNNPQAGKRRPSVLGGRPVEFTIPKSSPDQAPQGAWRPSAPSPGVDSTSPGSFWLPPSPRPSSRNLARDIHPLSYAEINTNAAYQPFHTDGRVNFYVYNDDPNVADPHHLQSGSTWVFGAPIPATKISTGSTVHGNGDPRADPDGQVRMENVVSPVGNEEEGQQFVVTTRRKGRNQGAGMDAGEGEDFFEDDLEVVDFAEDRV